MLAFQAKTVQQYPCDKQQKRVWNRMQHLGMNASWQRDVGRQSKTRNAYLVWRCSRILGRWCLVFTGLKDCLSWWDGTARRVWPKENKSQEASAWPRYHK